MDLTKEETSAREVGFPGPDNKKILYNGIKNFLKLLILNLVNCKLSKRTKLEIQLLLFI